MRLNRQESASSLFDAEGAAPSELKELIGSSVRHACAHSPPRRRGSPEATTRKTEADSPVAMQQWLIRSAFGKG